MSDSPIRQPLKVEFVERGGKYYFYEPGLAVIAGGGTVEEAYRQFTAARRQYLDDMMRAGLSVEARPKPRVSALKAGARSAMFFLAKTSFVVLLVLGIVGLFGNMAVQAMKPLAAISIAHLVENVGLIAKDLRTMPDGSKDALRQYIGNLSRELAPYGDAWRNPPLNP